MKPLVRQAFDTAFQDMKSEILKLRREQHSQLQVHGSDNYVVGRSFVDSEETRRLNEELGLFTNKGIEKWYE